MDNKNKITISMKLNDSDVTTEELIKAFEYKQKCKQSVKKYQQKNKEKINEYQKAYNKQMKFNNPELYKRTLEKKRIYYEKKKYEKFLSIDLL